MNLSWYHWLIVIVPVFFVCYTAFKCRRYVRSVADFLVAGRVAGRYVLLSGGVMGSLSVLTFVAGAEVAYQCGWAMNFWNSVLTPLGIMMGLFGWISFRFRETRAMSAGQFFEMRYSRGVRLLAASLRAAADMLANCIGPAVAARFFIYLLGIPSAFHFLGLVVPTFSFILAVCIILALTMILTGGRLSLLVTDALQGIISYPIFLVFSIYVICQFSWFDEIAPAMWSRVPGESFLNPYDIQNLRDFNLFALVVVTFNRFFGGQWVGNGYGTVARTPHEGKMSGIIGNWGAGFAYLLPTLFVFALLAIMSAPRFAKEAHAIRQDLAVSVAEEVSLKVKPGMGDAGAVVERIREGAAAIPEATHVMPGEAGLSATEIKDLHARTGLSREKNLETPYMDVAHKAMLETLSEEAQANKLFQNYRSLYLQQMLPVAIRRFFPPTLIALLIMLCILLTVSTDDTRIFDSSTTVVQDLILPLLKRPPSQRTHIAIFKIVNVCVGIFFFFGSIFLSQLDYITMFVTIMCSIWVAGAGAVVTCGLYWRRGTSAGAYAALISGGGLSIFFVIIQRCWGGSVFPWLLEHGWADNVGRALEALSSPFHPWIVWKGMSDPMYAVKFPINSTEINFLASAIAVALYFIVSLATCREPFNLERMLHRGIYNLNPEKKDIKEKFGWRKFINYFVSITPDYTRGDKIITWAVFCYSIGYGFLFGFITVALWARFGHWGFRQWSVYSFIATLIIPFIAGLVTTVWFMWGGIKDLRRLFRDLETRQRDDLDNGQVEGNVSIADTAVFAEREAANAAFAEREAAAKEKPE